MPTAPAHLPSAGRRALTSTIRAGAVAALPAVADPAAAQGAPTASDARGWSHPGPAVTPQDAVTLNGGAVAAVALMRVDERVARWSQRRTVQGAPGLRPVAGAFRVLGDPGALAAGSVTHAIGLARRDRAVADVGLHATGAIAAAGVVTGVIKATAGRAPPYVTGDSNAHSFGFARGLRRGNAYQAFPSGHATAAFAFAAALSGEARHRWARANRVTEPLAYTAASLVALWRVYHDRHWASDALMGSAIGLVTGRALVRYQHARPENALDGRLLPRRAMRAAAIPAAVPWSIRC